jgi:hypothetical protein
MSDYIDKMHDQRLNESADTEIDRQKYEIAAAATPRLSSLLLAQVKRDCAKFETKFGKARISVIAPDPTGYDVRDTYRAVSACGYEIQVPQCHDRLRDPKDGNRRCADANS